MSQANKEEASQFDLLKTRRFLPFFFTQVLGALNDNVFKNALMAILAFSAADALPLDTNLVMNIAAGLFILPFFIFSAAAGDLADKMEKSKLIRYVKLAEIGIMLLGAFAFIMEQYMMLLGILFLMGTQSAFFGPVKYAILPQLIQPKELVGGNALVEMGTFLAILAGTIAGNLFGGSGAINEIAMSIIVLSIIGYLVSRQIPQIPVLLAQDKRKWQFRPIKQTMNALRIARKNEAIFLSIMAISWFWFLGASYLTQFPNFGKQYLGGDASVVTALLVAFSVGVAVGSLLCEKLSGKQIELGIVPIGAIGLTIFGIDIYFAAPQTINEQMLTLSAFFEQSYAWRVLIDLTFIGVFGGFFIVPLYALLQQRAEESERARVIAANNIFNALFMVVSAISGIIFLTVMELSIPQYFACVAIMNMVVALYVFAKLPEFVLRFAIWILCHTIYRVRYKGFENIPNEGAAVLICNHVSFVDPLLLAGSVRRPVRFVMDAKIYNTKGLHWFFKAAQTIPICSPKQDPETYEQAFKSIKEVLDNGDIVGIFPEGKLTRDGEISEFKGGIERIIQETPVPVVPMALQGLWGSFFSHHGGRILQRTAKRFWSRVSILVEAPIAPENVKAADLETKIKQLRSDKP